ncbi:MAG: PKD domain-containing protein [Actinomycetota bacterium]
MTSRFRRSLAFIVALSAALVAGALTSVPANAGSGTPVFVNYPAPSSLANSDNAGEPSIGVDRSTGAVMFQAYASTYKVLFNDATVPATATWSDVTASSSVFNIDPILATDSSTGRTFAGGEAGACSVLNYTDNDGASWTQMTNACTASADHESIGSGAWVGLAPLGSTYSRAVYYCAQDPADSCSTSTNGGLTFGAPVTVSGGCTGLHGHVKSSADGTAYVPNNNCGGVGGAISRNNGSAWGSYVITGAASASRGFDPSVTTTPDNTLYEAWARAGDYHPMVARSTSHGSSWDEVTDLANTVSPPAVASTFQAMTSGDNGRIAVAWLGNQTPSSGIPFDNGYHGIWNLFVSYSYDGGLTWQTVQATSDPVQRGCIWDGGGSNVCRNLLDFMDASVTKDGRVVVSYADGCINACAASNGTEAESTDAYATIARQSTGKGLFAAYDSSGPTAPAAPSLSVTSGNAQASLSWTTPSDGGSSITGYKIYRSTSSGGETLYQSVGVQNSFTDTGLTNGSTYYYKVAAVNAVGTGTLSNEASAHPAASDVPPTACFTHSETGLSTSVNGSCSTDSDGTVTGWSWNWGDSSAAGSGSSATHTYAAAGTYTVTLTATDNAGLTNSTSQSVTVSGDPDPSTPNLTNGVASSGTSQPTAGTWQYYKISVPSGKSSLAVNLSSNETCGLLSCNPDLDLYVRNGSKPTTSTFDCSSTSSTSSESCSIPNPAAAYYYVGIYVYSGTKSLAYSIKATYS